MKKILALTSCLFCLFFADKFVISAETNGDLLGEYINKNAWVDIYFLAEDKSYFKFKLSAFNNLQLCEIDGSANFVGTEKNQAGYANQECSMAFKFENTSLQLTTKNCDNLCPNEAGKVLTGEYKKP